MGGVGGRAAPGSESARLVGFVGDEPGRAAGVARAAGGEVMDEWGSRTCSVPSARGSAGSRGGPARSSALRRLSFGFAADGSHAACLAASPEGGWHPETWRLGGGPAEAAVLAGPQPESLRSQLVSLPDGRVLICRHGEERHELALRGPAPAAPERAATAPAAWGPAATVLTADAPVADAPVAGGHAADGAAADGLAAGRPAAGARPVARAAGGEVEDSAGVLRCPGVRVVAMPAPASAAVPGAPIAVALAADGRPVTTAWLVFGGGREPQPVAEVPGIFGGGIWLDDGGRLLALDRLSAGRVKTVVLDLARSEVSPLLEITPESNDRLALADPVSGLLVVRSDAPGEDRLGWGVLGGGVPVRFPECLHQPGALLRPLAVEPPEGRRGAADVDALRVLVQRDRGACSTLALWRPWGGGMEQLPVPPGRLGGVAHWSAAGLRIPYSAPDRPPGMATIQVERLLAARVERQAPMVSPLPLRLAPLQVPAGARPGSRFPAGVPRPSPPAPGEGGSAAGGPEEASGRERGWRLDGSAAPPEGGRWRPARLLELAGAAGSLEAVVYGGDAWLTADHLVLALHGGPADAWRLEFDPALQRLAAEGLAVVAPNYRGSTGYGTAHAAAIRGAWGGPDLEDVLVLLDGLAGQRVALGLEPPSLFGVSYGAFLALLAAAAAADQVARCAVVAPFLSGARLLGEGTESVRALVTRLGGAQELHDARGPRDVLQVCHRLVAPLLMLHGDQDAVVPVSQSRTLRRQLLRIGRLEGTDFRYVEAAGAGHELLAEQGSAVLHELLAVFLRSGRPA